MDKLFDPGRDFLDTLRGIEADAQVRSACTLSEDEFAFTLEAGASLHFDPDEDRDRLTLDKLFR